jgi:hypothetical protein
MLQVIVEEVGGQQIVAGETVVQQIVVGKKLLGQKMGTFDE